MCRLMYVCIHVDNIQCNTGLPLGYNVYSKLYCLQGAPERILERCKHVRINGARREFLSESMRDQILDRVIMYGTGADTLRCLALATVDDPIPTAKMNLQDPATFCDYEVKGFLKIFSLHQIGSVQTIAEPINILLIVPYNLVSLCVIVLSSHHFAVLLLPLPINNTLTCTNVAQVLS